MFNIKNLERRLWAASLIFYRVPDSTLRKYEIIWSVSSFFLVATEALQNLLFFPKAFC